MIQALLKVQLGPDVPEKGVRTWKEDLIFLPGSLDLPSAALARGTRDDVPVAFGLRVRLCKVASQICTTSRRPSIPKNPC